ncbi:hypothetical protein P20652_1606 [Pseudoalteromonas sp. BSi20652]|uniref:hypothetical protein n=1 Tax=Pseudoalteromonas sp. BSi20652 TaxID=388384 RepID=UPI0002316AA7|nr:hypothetical protein [Pseudoalteromonas sp. BSi20652]GAA59742.1 hypothetical protein P20652_1606 [Pseudoalteromonas sp. BSi20652]
MGSVTAPALPGLLRVITKSQAKLSCSAYSPTYIHASSKESTDSRKNPKGCACLAFMLRYRLFMINSHTAMTLPCFNTQ